MTLVRMEQIAEELEHQAPCPSPDQDLHNQANEMPSTGAPTALPLHQARASAVESDLATELAHSPDREPTLTKVSIFQ
jgi:hypothetical protein